MTVTATAGESDRVAEGADPVLELRRVVKSFNGQVVLDLEALEVGTGEVHALLGQNGSGKSTLIKVLAGYHAPDPHPDFRVAVAGADVTTDSRGCVRPTGFRFVHQDLGLVAQMSVLDNVYLDRGYPTRGWTVKSSTARSIVGDALTRVGLASLDPERLVATLSPADRTGVAIARALAGDRDDVPKVLVLDEPTATLPGGEVERLLSMLSGIAADGAAVLYVTHHLDEVFKLATTVTVLRDGHRVAWGPTNAFTHAEIVHHLVGAELETVGRPAAGAPGTHASHPVDGALVVDGVVGDRFDGMSFSVAPGEIVGVHGVSGSGRDSLLGAVFGARDRGAGSVRIAGHELPARRPDLAIGLGVGYVPADRKAQGGLLGLRARENVTLPALRSFWRRGRLCVADEVEETREWFGRLDVRPVGGVDLPLASFSGGNQQKIILAKWLRQRPRVLLLDEPTQGVDVGAKAVIQRTLLDAAAAGLAIVIASSDEKEMAALCSTVHVARRGRLVDTLKGDEISETELRRRLHEPDHNPTSTEGAPS